jgi:hypothetical protein
MSDDKSYWFGGKRYLLGWGVPVRWQGWAVLVAFVAAELIGPLFFPQHGNSMLYSVYSAAVIAAFLVLCLVKSEPPH